MSENSRALIAKYKERKFLKDLYNQNVIEMDDWFRCSDKAEANENLIALVPEYRKKQIVRTFTDMSKYQLDNKLNHKPTYKNINRNDKKYKADSSRVFKEIDSLHRFEAEKRLRSTKK